jgi:hypothetical protein
LLDGSPTTGLIGEATEHAPAVALQRDPPPGRQPAPDPRVTDLEARTAALEKRQAATALDLEYRGIVGQRLSAYRQTIYRLTGAFQGATNGFQGAQQRQAQSDAIRNQIVAMIVAVGAAGLAEPFLAASLGALGPRLGVAAAGITRWVEALENPLNALTAGGASTLATAAGGAQARAGQTPPVGGAVQAGAGGGTRSAGDPMSFLTANLEAIEVRSQALDQAFTARASAQSSTTPEQWARWDAGRQRTAYAEMVAQLDAAAPPSVDFLKAADELARVIERYMWAAWITANFTVMSDVLVGDADQITGMGSEIEDRLNAVGVSSRASVTLTGHWYSANSSHAATGLRDWAAAYREGLTTR